MFRPISHTVVKIAVLPYTPRLHAYIFAEDPDLREHPLFPPGEIVDYRNPVHWHSGPVCVQPRTAFRAYRSRYNRWKPPPFFSSFYFLLFFSSPDRMEIAQPVGRDAVTWPQIATRWSDDLLFPTSLFRVRRKFVFIATWIVRDARKSLAQRPYRALSKQSDRTSKHARFINAFFAHRVIVVPVQLIYRGLT